MYSNPRDRFYEDRQYSPQTRQADQEVTEIFNRADDWFDSFSDTLDISDNRRPNEQTHGRDRSYDYSDRSEGTGNFRPPGGDRYDRPNDHLNEMSYGRAFEAPEPRALARQPLDRNAGQYRHTIYPPDMVAQGYGQKSPNEPQYETRGRSQEGPKPFDHEQFERSLDGERRMPGMNGYPGYSSAVFDKNDTGGMRDPYYGRSRDSPPYGRQDDYRRPPNREDIYAKPQPRYQRESNGYGPAAGRFSLEEGHVFELDHLATFTVGPKQGLASPESGLERLRSMEMTTGIWTMRCQLAVEPRHLVIIDKATGSEMERFPLELVVDAMAKMNKDRRDVYNNILLFSVLGDRGHSPESEMHIFQCISCPAQQLADEINMTKKGQYSRRPAYATRSPPPQRPSYNGDVMGDHTARAAAAYAQREPVPFKTMKPRTNEDNRDTESILSENTDRNLQMLNLCFDDIEVFVARLQQAAEAFRELERRRQKKDKKKNGDGMLSGRARPPPAKDFIDIFQKFKLAFNLLARVKPYIHDPNAPELVHFLFTPLSLVVEASRDPRSNTPDLPARVVAPMLTADAKELLVNCLTTKEMELWRSLGDTWTISRDQYSYPVPAYTPRFYNGWSPAPNVLDDASHRPPPSREDRREPQQPSRGYREDPYSSYERSRNASPAPRGPAYGRPDDRRAEDPYYSRQPEPNRNSDYSRDYPREEPPRNDPYSRGRDDSRDQDRGRTSPAPVRQPSTKQNPGQSFEDDQRAFLRDLQGKRAMICEVKHERDGKNSKELSVRKGEYLEVLDNNRNWWKLKNSAGQVGHAPYTILELLK